MDLLRLIFSFYIASCITCIITLVPYAHDVMTIAVDEFSSGGLTSFDRLIVTIAILLRVIFYAFVPVLNLSIAWHCVRHKEEIVKQASAVAKEIIEEEEI